jgi:arylsulfatase A-like enzyme
MKVPNLDRRDFIKLLLLLPALQTARSQSQRLPGEKHYGSRGQGKSPNVLLLVFDTLSARHMSLYGYDRNTTPHFSRFAENAVVFHRHYSGGSFTSPGTASLLTGTYPWSHRAVHLHGSVGRDVADRNIFRVLGEGYHTRTYTHNPLAATLFHQFKNGIDDLVKIEELTILDHSMAESFFFNDYPIAYESELLQLRSGNTPTSSLFLSILDEFRRYVAGANRSQDFVGQFPRGLPNYMDEAAPSFLYFTLEDAVDWLEIESPRLPNPFFQYIHLLPPHGPYTTRREFVDVFDDGWAPSRKARHFFSEDHSEDFLLERRRYYDEFIAYVDAEFGRLVEALDRSGCLDNTYLIVTSDHGQLFERGIHGHLTPTMYEGLIHIPLIVSRPGKTTRKDIFSPTSCVDLLPTLLHLTGQPVPGWCEGEVLPGFGASTSKDRSIFCVDAKRNAKHRPLSQATVAMIKGAYKLVRYFGYEELEEAFELFDVEQDPEERKNLYVLNQTTSTKMKRLLMEHLRQANDPFN